MKKMLRTKFEKMSSVNSMLNPTPIVSSSIYPPLPLDPPPPDNVIIKQEIEDKAYESSSSHTPNVNSEWDDSWSNGDSLSPNITNQQPRKGPTPQMCKRYARGTCTRGSYCKFEHKIYHDQLKDVYKFCWDYQNTKCKRQICYHVHATVFEEMEFYRTAKLPPLVIPPCHDRYLGRKKQMQYQSTMLAQQPMFAQQPPPQSPSVHPNIPPQFNYPPPPLPAISTVPHIPYNVDPPQGFCVPTTNNSPKQTWTMANASSSPRDPNAGEPLAKKCKKCDVNEFRLNFNKDKRNQMKTSTSQLEKEIITLEKKRDLVFSFVLGIGPYCDTL